MPFPKWHLISYCCVVLWKPLTNIFRIINIVPTQHFFFILQKKKNSCTNKRLIGHDEVTISIEMEIFHSVYIRYHFQIWSNITFQSGVVRKMTNIYNHILYSLGCTKSQSNPIAIFLDDQPLSSNAQLQRF